ncbi:TonB-dependent receptor [Mucilaginibacter aquaedulcis]|uniref:TonB-dependent receptor n=1 Tax=Mucilaginibacter aquaedulcis TaxID=1187081 RepID=UPI0025B4A366|nr:TonB-dependent receptor [Mucilaginibacter aquaedulcis]MDN3548789.1 TonB-dependent receptor [Mucilaginibacter aquaedulcis]
MYYKFLLVVSVCLLTSSFQVFAQNFIKLTGTVVDSAYVPINGANVVLLNKSDTLKTRSGVDGAFSFSFKFSAEIRLNVSYVGLKEFSRLISISEQSGDIILEPIKLNIFAKELKEVLIRYKVKPVVYKIDTTEYNVSSFSVDDSDVVQELLKKLPGLELDKDGNLTAEGKPVQKLRIDGQDFFTGDVREFVRQLPAGIFSKVQIVNDYGEEAAFSGIKKGTASKQLNLVTKPGMNKGIFGSVTADAGTNEQFGAGVSANYWKGPKQLSATADLKTSSSTVGTNVTIRANLYYADQAGPHLKIAGGYGFTDAKSGAQNNSFSETVNSMGVIRNDIQNSSTGNNGTNNLNFSLRYDPDKATYLKINFVLDRNISKGSSASHSVQSGLINQSLISSDLSNNRAFTQNIDVTLGRRLGKSGRVITMSFQGRSNQVNNTQQLYRNIIYNDTLGNFLTDSILNNFITNRSKSFSTNLTLNYSEPLSEKSTLNLSYEFSSVNQNTGILTEVNLPQRKLLRIDSLSQSSDNLFTTQRIDASYNFRAKKFSLSNGLSLQENSLSGIYGSRVDKISQRNYNFSPTSSLNFNPTSSFGLNFTYSGSSRAPSVDELRPVQDIRNLQNLVIGNPNLKPEFNHILNINFRYFGEKSHQYLNAGLSASVMQNKIVNNTLIVMDTLNVPKQLTSFVNANGSYRLGGNYGYSIPMKFSKLSLSTSISGSLDATRQVIYTDNTKAFNYGHNFSQTIKTVGKLGRTNTDIRVTYSRSLNKYQIGQGLLSIVQSWSFSLNENLTLFPHNFLITEVNKSLIRGYTNIEANNPLIINASINQQFLEQQQLSLRLQATDILNQANRISQTMIGNSIVNNKTTYITRFFTLGMNYKFSKFARHK